MTLISIILALAAERFLGSLEDYRRWEWHDRYSTWLEAKGGSDGLVRDSIIVIFAILLPALFVQLVILGIGDVFFLFEGILGIVVLVFCLGPKSFYEQIKEFCSAYDSGNTESAIWYLESILDRPLNDGEKKQLLLTTVENLLVIAHDRIFAPIIWFLLLGPFGALVYRMLSRTQRRIGVTLETGDVETDAPGLWLSRLHFYATWPTAKLLGLIYAVTGNFVEGVAAFKNEGKSCSAAWADPNERTLVCAGRGAINLMQDTADLPLNVLRATIALIRRSVLFFVGLIALMTLSGWMV